MKHIKLLFLLFIFSITCNYGQIITFNFNGLTGSEVTANSNSNDVNLSASTISRGAGLNATNNGNRFNANNWALTSIANAITGNDYMEFTITPNSGFQFDVTTIDVNFQRSGTGTRGILLRSSLDSYAANIDTEKVILDNTSVQTFSFTVGQTNNTTSITYRVYGWAESTGGTGGFEGTGNDLIVNGSVNTTTPTPTIIVNPTTLTNLDYVLGSGPSAEQTFTAEATLLTTDLVLTAPTNFEISTTSGSGFGSSINLTPSTGTVASTTIYTRLNAGLGVNTYSGNVTATSTGATTQNVAVSGEVTAPIADVVITEIMYNTPVAGGTDDEWIEICNISGSTQDLSGYTIDVDGSLEFTFPSGATIINGNCITIALGSNGDATFNIDCPFTPDYSNGSGSDTLVNAASGDTITLYAVDGVSVADSVYFNDVITGTDGGGASLQITDITLDNSNISSNWQAVTTGGSPGSNSLISQCGLTEQEINVEGNIGSFPDIANGETATSSLNNTLFATTVVGNSQSKSFRIQNLGPLDLTVSGVTIVGLNPSDFSVSVSPVSPITSSNFTLFEITFTPTAVGSRIATVSIANNDTDENPFTFNIEGTGACGASVTWDGTVWDNGTGPTLSNNAIIDGTYNTSTSSFTACTLDITSNGVLTISANSYVEVINDIQNAGQIVIADTGSLVQVAELATFTNTSAFPTPVTVARRTAPVAAGAWYEYTYWSSPVPETTLESLLPNTSAVRKFSFDGSQFHDNQAEIFNTGAFTANSRDDIDDDANDWQYASGVMTPALGYAATLGPDDLLGPGGGSTGITKNFEGNTLNTGTIDITVNRNDLSILDNNWNLIGNPYASAIDVNLFFTENQQGSSPNGVLDGSIYLWSHSTPPSATTQGNENLNFDVNDYAIINLSANTAGEDGLTPNNTIGSGQGFFVLYSEAAASTTSTVRFTNAMRITGDNEQFYRTDNSDLDNKLWLNLTSDNGVFSQLAIAYVNGATNGDDGPSYDARRFYSGASAMLVSYAENSTMPLAIQGKQTNALDSNEVIQLGLKTGITSPTIYSISINNFQGDFLTNNAIYIKDNLLNTYQDLTLGDYSFTSEMGEFNSRFEIVFTQPSLGIEEQILAANSLSIIEAENDNVTFKLKNSNRTIKQIKIFDALGRVLYNLKGNSSTETYNLSNLSQATYIAQIELDNGIIISKKAIKK